MSATAPLADVDLRGDALACWIVKDEAVSVEFAASAGLLQSGVGINRYEAGDALVTGSTGDRWCVSRARFDAKHLPQGATRAGEDGLYRNIPLAIRGRCMAEPFSVARSAGGDVLEGKAGDWLVQYAPGDHGIVARARFDQVYRIVPGPAH
jgi:hypothetical protein